MVPGKGSQINLPMKVSAFLYIISRLLNPFFAVPAHSHPLTGFKLGVLLQFSQKGLSLITIVSSRLLLTHEKDSLVSQINWQQFPANHMP
jgi:hypothetical protein